MIFFLGYATIFSLQKMLDNTGAVFIVLFTQEINLHPTAWDNFVQLKIKSVHGKLQKKIL